MFGCGITSKPASEQSEESIAEAVTMCLAGKIGYYFNIVWLCIYAYHYFIVKKTAILSVLGVIVGSILLLFIMVGVMMIPVINRLLITLTYLYFTIIPSLKIRSIVASKSTKEMNGLTLLGNLSVNLGALIIFGNLMKDTFKWTGFIVIVGFFLSLLQVFVFCYLRFFYGSNSDGGKSGEEREDAEGRGVGERLISSEDQKELGPRNIVSNAYFAQDFKSDVNSSIPIQDNQNLINNDQIIYNNTPNINYQTNQY